MSVRPDNSPIRVIRPTLMGSPAERRRQLAEACVEAVSIRAMVVCSDDPAHGRTEAQCRPIVSAPTEDSGRMTRLVSLMLAQQGLLAADWGADQN